MKNVNNLSRINILHTNCIIDFNIKQNAGQKNSILQSARTHANSKNKKKLMPAATAVAAVATASIGM